MCIYLLNGHPRVKARVAEVGVTALAVAIPTVGELYFGAYNSGRMEATIARVRAFLSSMSPPPNSLADSRPSYAAQADRLATLISSSLVWPCAMG
jgi:predicted nucleic acid-binding protein